MTERDRGGDRKIHTEREREREREKKGEQGIPGL